MNHDCNIVLWMSHCFGPVLKVDFARETVRENLEASVHRISVCFLSFLHLFNINGEGGCVLISKFCKLSLTLFIFLAQVQTHTRGLTQVALIRYVRILI